MLGGADLLGVHCYVGRVFRGLFPQGTAPRHRPASRRYGRGKDKWTGQPACHDASRRDTEPFLKAHLSANSQRLSHRQTPGDIEGRSGMPEIRHADPDAVGWSDVPAHLRLTNQAACTERVRPGALARKAASAVCRGLMDAASSCSNTQVGVFEVHSSHPVACAALDVDWVCERFLVGKKYADTPRHWLLGFRQFRNDDLTLQGGLVTVEHWFGANFVRARCCTSRSGTTLARPKLATTSISSS